MYILVYILDYFTLLYETTKDVIFLQRTSRRIGVKLFSTVYHCIRIVLIVKMLNHEVESFRDIARNSLALDMKNRGVDIS